MSFGLTEHFPGERRRRANLIHLDMLRVRPFSATWGRDPLREGEDPGGGAGTRDAQVDRASGTGAGLAMRAHEPRTRLPRYSNRGPPHPHRFPSWISRQTLRVELCRGRLLH